MQVIVDAKKQLLEIFRGQLASAEKEEKHADVLRFVKLISVLDAKVWTPYQAIFPTVHKYASIHCGS